MSAHSRRRFLALGTAAGAAAAARPVAAQILPRAPGQQFSREIVLGVCVPLSGEMSAAGAQVVNGVRQAVYEANRMIGNLDRSFGMRTFDDQNSIVGGIMNAQFAGDDPSIIATVGHLNASITDATLSQYANAKMPLVVPASSADSITAHGYRNVFRLPTKDSTEGQLFARFLAASPSRPAHAVALTQDGDYGKDVARGFVQQLGAQSVRADTIAFAEKNPPLADIAKKILAIGADYVFLAGNTDAMGPLLPVLRAAGFAGAFGASQGFYNAQTIQTYARELAEATISTSMPPVERIQAVNDYLSDLRGNYGGVTPLLAFGFAAAQLVVNAIRRTGASDRLSLLRAFANGTPFETLVGTFGFGFSGDPLDPNLYFYSIRNGQFVYTNSAHANSFLIST